MRLGIFFLIILILFTPPVFAKSVDNANIPQLVGVLPVLGNAPKEDKKTFRTIFNNYLTSKRFQNIKLDEIDIKLVEIEKETGKKWSELSPSYIGKKMKLDGLFIVKSLSINKLFVALYASISIKAKVIFVRSEDGEIIWQKEASVARRSGGIPLSPWSAISTTITSARVLRDCVKMDLMAELCRKLTAKIPEPAVPVIRKPPPIFTVMTNAKDSPFGMGKEILIAIKAKPNCIGYCQISGVIERLRLTEKESGNYLGRYVVDREISTKNKFIKITLLDPDTRLENNYIVPYPIEIDGIPPSPVKEINISTLQDKIVIKWEPVRDAYEYIIERNEGSEFKCIGKTQVPEFEDINVIYGKIYYYKIYVKDKAGNLSEPLTKKVIYIKPGPTVLPDRIMGDFIMYPEGSPYVITKKTVVLKGSTLTAKPGVIVELKKGAVLKVNGNILIKGMEKDRVVFKGEDYIIQIEDTGKDGFIAKNLLLDNGSNLAIINSEAIFENVIINNFKKGLVIKKNSLVKADNLEIRDSYHGIDLKGGTISGSKYIIRNCNYALYYEEGNIKAKIFFSRNTSYINAASDLNLDCIVIDDYVIRHSLNFIKGIKGNVNIRQIIPLNYSLRKLRLKLYNSIKVKLFEALIENDPLQIKKLTITILNCFRKEALENDKEVILYLAERCLGSSNRPDLKPFKRLCEDNFYKILKDKKDNYKVVPLKVTFPSFLTNISPKLISKKAKEKILFSYIKKMNLQDIKGKFYKKLSNSIVYTIVFAESSAKFVKNYYLLCVIDKKILNSQFKKPKKRPSLKIGLIIHTEYQRMIELIRSSFKNQGYDLFMLPSTDIFTALSYIKKRQLPIKIILFFNYDIEKTKSTISANLFIYSCNLRAKIVDVSSGQQLSTVSAESAVYQVSDTKGKELAAIKSFKKLKNKLKIKLLELAKQI